MAQHKMKKKTTLPAGAKQKSMKRVAAGNAKSKGQKKGMNGKIAAKKTGAVCDAKISNEVSKMINQKNEELLRARADRDVGKTKK